VNVTFLCSKISLYVKLDTNVCEYVRIIVSTDINLNLLGDGLRGICLDIMKTIEKRKVA
jgi:hypothetical protein